MLGAGFAGSLGQGNAKTLGDEPKEMGDRLRPVDLGTVSRPKVITAAGLRSCVIFEDQNLKCWGSNSFGALGVGDTANRGSAAGQMGAALPPVSLGTGRFVRAVATGLLHTCALLDDGKVKCWGQGEDGMLGYGDTVDRGANPGDMADHLPALDFGQRCVANR
jgi:hypothetical protein